jgi:hypothetical protein
MRLSSTPSSAMITNTIKSACALLIAILAAGCGSDGNDPPAPPPPDTLNMAKVAREVINETNCGGPLCHTGTAAGFKLGNADALHAELVGKTATGAECGTSGRVRVVPSDSASSLLYLKIAGGGVPCGDPMPPPPQTISSDKIELVRLWIDEGAVK